MRLPGSSLDAGIEDRLRTESVLWLGTTSPDGAPHLVPVWFVWDGQAFLVFSKPGAVKVRHIEAEPRVAIALGEADDDFDVQLVKARADLLDRPTAEVVPDALFEKYRDQLAAIGLTRAEYVATYSQAIRIVPTRFLPWRGRSWLAGRRQAPTLVAPVALRGSLPAWA